MKSVNSKKKNYISIVLLLVLVIGIGYAYLNSNLSITGSTSISNNTWDVHFEDIVVTEGSVAIDTNSYADAKAATIDSNDTTKVTYNILLSKPGDFYEFTVKAVNDGTIDAMIESISSKIKIGTGEEQEITSSNLPSWLNYSVTYSDGVAIATNHLLAHDSYETYKIRVEFKKDINGTELQDSAEKHIQLTYDVTYTQSDDNGIEKPILRYVYSGDQIDEDNNNVTNMDDLYTSYDDFIDEYSNHFFLRFKVVGSQIVERSVGFLLDDVPYYLTVGKYDENKETMKAAFGAESCEESLSSNNTFYSYYCSYEGYYAKVTSDSTYIVAASDADSQNGAHYTYEDWSCDIHYGYNNIAGCGFSNY